jgi:hypothetical protein
MIRSFTQMMLSKDEKVREAMRWFAENERIYRCIGEDPESDFLNWRDEKGVKGTASLTARTRNTCKDLKIKLKLLDEEEGMLVKTEESELKTKTAVGIGHFLTQKVIRPNMYKKLIEHEVHGASFITLKGNEASNKILTDIYTRRSDAFFRFVVVGRADCLPTPVNLRRWFEGPREEVCRRCGKERQQTMAHILNECTQNYQMMTKRHNMLANVVRKGVEKYLASDLRSIIQENEEIVQEGLQDDLRRLRPDMVFERQRSRTSRGVTFSSSEDDMERERENRVTEIIEFSCPYGYISNGKNTLEKVYEEKKRKYTELARSLKRLRRGEVRVTAVIVSSMGAIYDKSLKDLQKVLGCTDREMRKLGRKMSEAVIRGSMEIWRQSAKKIFQGEASESEGASAASAVMEEEIRQLDQEELEERREAIEATISGREEDDAGSSRGDEEDEFEPEEGREELIFEIDPGYVVEARVEAEAEAEAEMGTEVGNIVEVEVRVEAEDRREGSPEEQVETEPGWSGKGRRGRGRRGRTRGGRKRLKIGGSQQVPEADEMTLLGFQGTGVDGIGRIENPADDEETPDDNIWI